MTIDDWTESHLRDYCEKVYRPEEVDEKLEDMLGWLEWLDDEDAQYELDAGWRQAFDDMTESMK